MANVKRSAAKRAAGKRTESGNVVLDLGEEMDRLISHGKKTGYRAAGLGAPPRWTPGGWRPSSMSGGWRPGLNRTQLGMAIDMPATADPMQVLGGSLAGTAVNRVLRRAIPKIIPSLDKAIVVDAISAGLGVLPYFLARKNGFTIGFAIPGILNLAGTLVDKLLDATKILSPAPALGAPAAMAEARQKLADIRNRMAAIGRQPVPQRVAAVPRIVA